MHLFALLLVVSAAGIHASWNLLVKRAAGGSVFVWLYAVTSTVLWAPVTIPTLIHAWPRLGAIHWLFLIGSGLIHTEYFLLLQRGYARGDLSVVYPLARGTGPLLSTLMAIAIYRERPSALALLGIALLLIGIGLFSAPGLRLAAARPGRVGVARAVMYGVGTGLLIAFYTVWDKYAVATLALSPLLMEWITSATRVLCLLPLAWTHRGDVTADWQHKRGYAVAIGVLNPLSYLLVLTAMQFSPVSFVAPTREISILFGVFFGAHLLREGELALRLAAATVMVVGVMLVASG